MFDPAILELLQAELRIVRGLVPRPKQDAARFARTVRESLGEFIKNAEALRKIYDNAWQQLYNDEIEDSQGAGRVLRDITDGQLTDFETTSQFLPEAEGEEPQNNREEFFKAGATLQAMLKELTTEWPWIDHEQVRIAREAIERGEFYTAKDALDELRDTHP
jgi:hypothetical protein